MGDKLIFDGDVFDGRNGMLFANFAVGSGIGEIRGEHFGSFHIFVVCGAAGTLSPFHETDRFKFITIFDKTIYSSITSHDEETQMWEYQGHSPAYKPSPQPALSQ